MYLVYLIQFVHPTGRVSKRPMGIGGVGGRDQGIGDVGSVGDVRRHVRDTGEVMEKKGEKGIYHCRLSVSGSNV